MLLKTYVTSNYHGFNVRFCPFKKSQVACAASKDFGISGTGAVFLVEDVLGAATPPVLFPYLEWGDVLFDLSWSEANPDVLVTASGDSCLQVWNLQHKLHPTRLLQGHKKEVVSADWNQTRVNQLLVSGSWDKTAKIWDCDVGQCLSTFVGHAGKLYSVVWSPLISHCFATSSEDGYVHLWSTATPSHPVLRICANSGEVLSCAWNYYDKDLLVTTGTDNIINGWDLRNPKCPVFQLHGHSYAVKKIKFSPHMKSILSTVSYDFTTRIWDSGFVNEIQCFQNHSEFACGIDFNSQITGLMADCGWDQKMQIFTWPCLPKNF